MINEIKDTFEKRFKYVYFENRRVIIKKVNRNLKKFKCTFGKIRSHCVGLEQRGVDIERVKY